MHDQKIAKQADESAIVEARVAGVVGTTRWVLAWGSAAETLEPEALRSIVRTELA